MENIFAILVLISFVFLIIGFFSPKVSLFWDKKNQPTRKRVIFIYGFSLISSFILFGITSDDIKPSDETYNSKNNKKSELKKPLKEVLSQKQLDSIKKEKKLKRYTERKSKTVSAKQLTRAFIENEISADDDFKDKRFYVYGKVTDIKKDIFDDVYVTLQGNEMFREVQCFFDNKQLAAKLKKGMYITFYGKCDGLMMNVLMKDCKLVENLDDLK